MGKDEQEGQWEIVLDFKYGYYDQSLWMLFEKVDWIVSDVYLYK